MSEVQFKIGKLKEILEQNKLGGIVLRGVDWFSWATAGGQSGVILTRETGVAEVFVTLQGAWILTNQIENPRLSQEEVTADFTVQVFPWEDPAAADRFVREMSQSKKIASDRPKEGELALPNSVYELKLVLLDSEIERYRKTGQLASQAMTAAMKQAHPDMTEAELAGIGARELLTRGLDPTLILVGNHDRVQVHRHPLPKNNRLGDSAMMVFCARGAGLYANLTRFTFFRPLSELEAKKFRTLRGIEAAALSATRTEKTISKVYQQIAQVYEQTGYGREIHNHHQGGPTGYLSREAIARPVAGDTPAEIIRNRMAFAWNPSLPGAKVEDTVLFLDGKIEVLTQDPEWSKYE